MKYIPILLIFMPFLEKSCFSQTSEDISGAWIVYDAEVVSPRLDSITLKGTVDVVKSYRYNFKKNGDLDYEDFIIKNAEGNWKLDNKTLNFTYTFDYYLYADSLTTGNQSITMEVLEVNDSLMIWNEELNKDENIKYFLRKQTTNHKK